MTRALEISGAARRDLLAITDYLGERSDTARRHFFDECDERFAALLSFPNTGRIVRKHRGRTPALRAFRVSSRFWQYRVFYRATSRSIRVVRILHSAQDVDAILRLANR